MTHRILILIPHPDDEVVGCAAMIQQRQQVGHKFYGLYLTTGVPAAELLWPWQRAQHASMVAKRAEESRKVASKLGIQSLGHSNRPTRSLRLHLDEALSEIRSAIDENAITEIWVPAFEGAHQDHDCANWLASQFVGQVAVSEFAEYNFAHGQVNSQMFIDAKGNETIIDLSFEEQAFKRHLLECYASERGNLAHIKSARECLRPLPIYDYSRPPHEGVLFFARFQWVPFRHPRVDYTLPAEVYGALAAHNR